MTAPQAKYARYIGRVGALAVALGVGFGFGTAMPAVQAETGSTSGSSDSTGGSTSGHGSESGDSSAGQDGADRVGIGRRWFLNRVGVAERSGR